jgi:hypothetical protein
MKRHLHSLSLSLLSVLLVYTVEAAQTTTSQAKDQLVPSNTSLGQCYAQVFVPPIFERKEVQELKREATERIEVIPAQYEWTEQTVMVQEPTERIEVVPATYEWVEERVLVKPASTRLEVVQPEYEEVNEDIVVKPAHSVWQKGSGPFQRIDHATGDIMCLIEQPPIYTTVSKQVVKRPAQTRTLEVPAEYTTIRKRVVKTPATVRTVKVPAQHKVIKVAKLSEEARTNRIEIPAEYQTITKEIQLREGRMEWQPVLCETNVTPEIVARVQRSLQRAGYDPGKIDGRLGTQTMASLDSYQREKGLPVGNLTFETLESLDIRLDGTTGNGSR